MQSRDLDKIMVRLPEGFRPRLAEMAKANRRSVNAEVVYHLEKVLAASASTAATGDRLDAANPAAAFHTTALQGGDIANPANGVP